MIEVLLRSGSWLNRGERCWYCFIDLKREEMSIDHMLPVGKGGSDEVSNLAICCKKCNWIKSDRDLWKWHKSIALGSRRKYVRMVNNGNFRRKLTVCRLFVPQK